MIIYDISWNHLLHLGWKEHPQNERIACKAFTMLVAIRSYQKQPAGPITGPQI